MHFSVTAPVEEAGAALAPMPSAIPIIKVTRTVFNRSPIPYGQLNMDRSPKKVTEKPNFSRWGQLSPVISIDSPADRCQSYVTSWHHRSFRSLHAWVHYPPCGTSSSANGFFVSVFHPATISPNTCTSRRLKRCLFISSSPSHLHIRPAPRSAIHLRQPGRQDGGADQERPLSRAGPRES